MKQAVLTSIKNIILRESSKPQPKESEVLVEIIACGICGSDLHIFEGDHPVIKPPVVMGHEFVGRVVELGEKVESLQIDDYVVAIPGVGCGACTPCQEGKFNLCTHLQVIGGHLDGAFSEFTLVPEENLLRIPSQLSFSEAALVESLAVAVHAVRRIDQVADRSFAVLGAGPIGLLIIQVLKAFGAKLVIASDPLAGRRQLARKLGADVLVNPLEQSLTEIALEVSDGLCLDGALDCAGLELTLNQALTITKNGGEVVITAIFGKNPVLPMRLLQRGEKKLVGTQMYVKEDFELALQLILEEKIKLSELITHYFKLTEIVAAFELASSRSPEVGKIMVEIK